MEHIIRFVLFLFVLKKRANKLKFYSATLCRNWNASAKMQGLGESFSRAELKFGFPLRNE